MYTNDSMASALVKYCYGDLLYYYSTASTDSIVVNANLTK